MNIINTQARSVLRPGVVLFPSKDRKTVYYCTKVIFNSIIIACLKIKKHKFDLH